MPDTHKGDVKFVSRQFAAVAILAGLAIAPTMALADTPSSMLESYTTQARKANLKFTSDADRGKVFFNAKHGQDWSCASCHTANPRSGGSHVVTKKAIEPLSPLANMARFTDPAKTEKWFRRNCNDVLARECSIAEKADLLAWLLSGM